MTTPSHTLNDNDTIRTIATGLTFTEGPRWHQGRWWFSDFYSHAIYTVRPDGSDLRKELDVPGQPSGLGWLPDGRLIFVSMTDRKVMRRETDGSVVVHADLSHLATGPANDIVVDEHGRAYVGNFGFDLMNDAPFATAKLVLITPQGVPSVVADDLHFPNGSIITPDGKTLLVGESFGNRTSAFDINTDGTLGPRRDWATYGQLPAGTTVGDMKKSGQVKFVPDGCCLDAEGLMWVADAGNGRVCRVAEGGKILETVNAGTGVFACMLGGDDGRDLLMCCAPDSSSHKRSVAAEAEVRVTRVRVPHAGFP